MLKFLLLLVLIFIAYRILKSYFQSRETPLNQEKQIEKDITAISKVIKEKRNKQI